MAPSTIIGVVTNRRLLRTAARWARRIGPMILGGVLAALGVWSAFPGIEAGGYEGLDWVFAPGADRRSMPAFGDQAIGFVESRIGGGRATWHLASLASYAVATATIGVLARALTRRSAAGWIGLVVFASHPAIWDWSSRIGGVALLLGVALVGCGWIGWIAIMRARWSGATQVAEWVPLPLLGVGLMLLWRAPDPSVSYWDSVAGPMGAAGLALAVAGFAGASDSLKSWALAAAAILAIRLVSPIDVSEGIDARRVQGRALDDLRRLHDDIPDGARIYVFDAPPSILGAVRYHARYLAPRSIEAVPMGRDLELPDGTVFDLRDVARRRVDRVFAWEADASRLCDLTATLPELCRAIFLAPRMARAAVIPAELALVADPVAMSEIPERGSLARAISAGRERGVTLAGETIGVWTGNLDLLPPHIGKVMLRVRSPRPGFSTTGSLFWTTDSKPVPSMENRIRFHSEGRSTVALPVGRSLRWLAGGVVRGLGVVFDTVDDTLSIPPLLLVPAVARPAQDDQIPMVSIPAGVLLRGSSPDLSERDASELELKPIHVPSFSIDAYPYPGRPGVYPRIDVTLEEARYLCRLQGKRLCLEEEWERACKGPDQSAYPYGHLFDANTCYTPLDFARFHLRRNGAFPGCVSGFGVADMSGNINEWTDSSLSKGEVANSPNESYLSVLEPMEEAALDRVPMLRGGGDWGEDPADLRCAHREHFHMPRDRYDDDGFRCCRSARPDVGA